MLGVVNGRENRATNPLNCGVGVKPVSLLNLGLETKRKSLKVHSNEPKVSMPRPYIFNHTIGVVVIDLHAANGKV